MSSKFCRAILFQVVAQLSHNIGFDSSHKGALNILVDILEKFLYKAGKVSQAYSEQCLHSEVHLNDLLQTFQHEQFSTSELIEYFQQMEESDLFKHIPKFPVPKSSNLQFPTEPHDNPDLEPYLPSTKFTSIGMDSSQLSNDLNGSQNSTTNVDSKSIHQAQDESDDDSVVTNDDIKPEEIPNMQGTAASSYCDTAGLNLDVSKECDSIIDNDESQTSADPLWVQQYAAKIENKDKSYSSNQSYSSDNAGTSENLLGSPLNLWDTQKSSRNKFSTSNRDSMNSKFGKFDNRRLQKTQDKNSYTSQIEEVARLLQDPIVEPLSRSSNEHYSASHQSMDDPESLIDENQAQYTEVFDSSVDQASKDANEADLMKFSHLLSPTSSSDEELNQKQIDIPQSSNKFNTYSPIKPPLTPSPAISNNSLVMVETDDEDQHYPMKNRLIEEEEEEDNVIDPNFDADYLSDDSPKLSVRTPTLEPVSSHGSFEKVKKRFKHKSSSKKRKQTESSQGAKSIEKLVLKKSKFTDSKLSSIHKDSSDRLPLPKLSAAVDVPVNKKKEKKEKKKKKDKDKDRESKKKSHKDAPPIPKLIVRNPGLSAGSHKSRVDQTSKYYSDIAQPKSSSKSKHSESKKSKQSSKKTVNNEIKISKKISSKKKDSENKSDIIAQPPKVEVSSAGIIYDVHGNKIWICPGCSKPDDGSPMIGCDDCDAWYHWPCVDIVKEPPEDEKWFCPNCIKTQVTKKKSSKRKRQR